MMDRLHVSQGHRGSSDLFLPHVSIKMRDLAISVAVYPWVSGLRAAEYQEHALDEQRRLISHRTGSAGFGHMFDVGPGWNPVEINADRRLRRKGRTVLAGPATATLARRGH